MAYDDDVANLVHGACLSSPVSPNIQYKGAWHQSPTPPSRWATPWPSRPWPRAGGTWNWTGPGGFTSTERTVTIPVPRGQAGVNRAVPRERRGCPSRFLRVGHQGPVAAHRPPVSGA
jgi:hypothetical protein